MVEETIIQTAVFSILGSTTFFPSDKMNNSVIKHLIDTYQLGNALEHFEYIMSVSGLEPYVEWVKVNTKPYKLTESYHNDLHARITVMNAYEGAVYSGLSQKETRQIILAAYFHDFNHSQGEHVDDRSNINDAEHGFIKAWDECDVLKDLTDREVVSRLIRRSIYPRIQALYKDYQASILCDADMMSAYQNKHSIDLIYGLYKEMIHSKKPNHINAPGMSEKERINKFIESHKLFYGTVKWNTHWARMKAFVLNFPLLNKNRVVELTNKLSPET